MKLIEIIDKLNEGKNCINKDTKIGEYIFIDSNIFYVMRKDYSYPISLQPSDFEYDSWEFITDIVISLYNSLITKDDEVKAMETWDEFYEYIHAHDEKETNVDEIEALLFECIFCGERPKVEIDEYGVLNVYCHCKNRLLSINSGDDFKYYRVVNAWNDYNQPYCDFEDEEVDDDECFDEEIDDECCDEEIDDECCDDFEDDISFEYDVIEEDEDIDNIGDKVLPCIHCDEMPIIEMRDNGLKISCRCNGGNIVVDGSNYDKVIELWNAENIVAPKRNCRRLGSFWRRIM